MTNPITLKPITAAEALELMLIPDVSFVTSERVVSENPNDFYYQAPDIAIEIISPSERVADIRRKVKQYLQYGTEQVWLIYPDTQEVVVNLANGTSMLPDFTFDMGKIFN